MVYLPKEGYSYPLISFGLSKHLLKLPLLNYNMFEVGQSDQSEYV